jgi:hypothetical protein
MPAGCCGWEVLGSLATRQAIGFAKFLVFGFIETISWAAIGANERAFRSVVTRAEELERLHEP